MPSHDQITILLHTSNRPDFLRRTLDYLRRSPSLSNIPVMIVDGSDAAHFPLIEALVNESFAAEGHSITHCDRSVPFHERLGLAVERCSTPYVILAADDDFYLPGWLDEALMMLDADPDLAAVYGHNLFFELESYAPRAPLVDYFAHPRRAPELKWLEQTLPADRLTAVSDEVGEPATPAWYALQRRAPLAAACRLAIETGTHERYLEYLQIFCQCALGKVRMIDRFTLARQENRNSKHFYLDPTEARKFVARLVPACANFLEEEANIPQPQARILAERFFKGIVHESERARAPLNLLRAKVARVRAVVALKEWVRGGDLRKLALDYPDPRFPQLPKVDETHPAVELVRGETRA